MEEFPFWFSLQVSFMPLAIWNLQFFPVMAHYCPLYWCSYWVPAIFSFLALIQNGAETLIKAPEYSAGEFPVKEKKSVLLHHCEWLIIYVKGEAIGAPGGNFLPVVHAKGRHIICLATWWQVRVPHSPSPQKATKQKGIVESYKTWDSVLKSLVWFYALSLLESIILDSSLIFILFFFNPATCNMVWIMEFSLWFCQRMKEVHIAKKAHFQSSLFVFVFLHCLALLP